MGVHVCFMDYSDQTCLGCRGMTDPMSSTPKSAAHEPLSSEIILLRSLALASARGSLGSLRSGSVISCRRELGKHTCSPRSWGKTEKRTRQQPGQSRWKRRRGTSAHVKARSPLQWHVAQIHSSAQPKTIFKPDSNQFRPRVTGAVVNVECVELLDFIMHLGLDKLARFRLFRDYRSPCPRELSLGVGDSVAGMPILWP